jgi:hypothetical protein
MTWPRPHSEQVARILADARASAKRETQLQRLMELRNGIAAASAYNSLGPCLAGSHGIWGDLREASRAIDRAIRRLRQEA